ncbi:helix-turn-helix domain-containing protein [Chryseobacterium sp. G0201]|uniref:helix-turn-helix domain-containing protein n=1 Tax=Chryseobacterium sp. G0201 TaxID=2487065 RepID=UPI000F4DF1A0|nr:helix-turn-helix domain-containing protein [Chryseobacterium sp. G0201]AZA53290.1 helix-turn-helix domain-containing protein [Chryseobacterium sp. G0201]
MMKHTCFFLLLISNLFFTQNKTTDNLGTLDYDKLKNKFYEYYENDNILKTKLTAEYYLQKAKKEKNNLQIAEGYILVHFNENFPIALKYIYSLDIITKNIKGSLYPTRTYLMKGNLYFKNDYLKKALDNYLIALQYAKEQKDQKQIAYANINIAYLNNYLGKYAEAAKTFRYYLHGSHNITNESQHNQIRVSLIYCYIELNKLDSANILIKDGLTSSFTNKSKYSVNQYSYFSGYAYLKQKKYRSAIIELLKAYNFFSSINDDNANYALYSLGKSYDGLRDKKKAVRYFTLLDFNVQKTNKTFPQLREVYTYLVEYYKENNNKEKQLYYIDRFLKVDKKLDEQFKYLSAEIPKKYDTPNLLQEKEDIINDLQNRKIILYVSIGFLSISLLLLSFFYYRSKKTEKKHRKIAQDLINSIELRSFETPEEKLDVFHIQEKEQVNIEDKIAKTTPEDVTQYILKELETFETKELFLKKGITSASLAKSIKTNTTYLSEVINTQKGKNFATYLNDLRIDFALNQLVKDKRFRSYKLSVIAEELGYNNEQAFSLAFKKKTGTTLSIYIKEIEHQTVPNNNTTTY